jgi:fructose-1,6-bisphosphatase/inositol monophosphatase family enzyme
MNLIELKDLAESVAMKAGDFLNKSKSVKKDVLTEEGRDIKLIIDQDTEKLIRSCLEKTNIDILGEEFSQKR